MDGCWGSGLGKLGGPGRQRIQLCAPGGCQDPLRWSTTLGMRDSDLDILCLGHKFGGRRFSYLFCELLDVQLGQGPDLGTLPGHCLPPTQELD